jgi:DNA repair exonuclease SbcCD nuclease subunit
MKQPDAILCTDLHIRETTPECRLDDFMKTQTRKHKWLRELQEKHNAPILVAGDVFNYWKPSPWLLSWTLRNLSDGIIAIPGQHDLPAHNLENIEKSGIQVLYDAGKIRLLTEPSVWPLHLNGLHPNYKGINSGICGFPWGTEIGGISPLYDYMLAIIHYGVYQRTPHYPGAENTGGTARSIIKKMPGFNLIVSGDNHLTFTERTREQLLVNPGSFMRTTAAQADHKPCVFLWYAEANTVEQVFVPIEDGVISREHIDKVEERDERLEAFISKLDHNIEITISFQENMRNYLAKNKISKSVSDIIWESMK